eukprot:CAMPEP_0172510834 /NCGR_PEP_ID=MMETSP1066-20121228/231783_1 /TAXON_ID=671091 /ORGANISM="Coscinodiscus wailesii, Strain CCMP2513" /LENGTH=279 /DNA_ID=CAMNT_0013289983 /DNA_START=64 /DNA_END=903 /DNA_ORIENTATION=+
MKGILHAVLLILLSLIPRCTKAFGGVSSRFFLKQGVTTDKPKLILIGGCPGTGKSTFGMAVALDQGILKCISTDTVRAVMRSFVDEKVSPALHRSSYAASFEGDDPVRSWKETCSVLSASVEELVDDAIKRGQSIVVEGVHVVPDKTLIDKWEEAGGVAIGCILQIKSEDKHKLQLRRRGVMTGAMEAEETKIMSFDRIRAIQDEMMRLAKESRWLQIEQRTAPDPLDLVAEQLMEDADCELPAEFEFEQQVDEMELSEMTELSHQDIDEKSTEGAISS